MVGSRFLSLALFSGLTFAATLPRARLNPRAVITPDNSCGGSKGYTCNPNDSFGGPCCSASGWCGKAASYCGTGCQTGFSTAGACTGSTGGGSGGGTGGGSGGGTGGGSGGGTGGGSTTWANHKEFTFTGSGLPAGLSASSGRVDEGGAATSHEFLPSLATVSGGYLNLVVPGGQSASGVLKSAEVATTFKMKYGSVKTTAIFSEPAGVCNGIFTYGSDKQESDIEWLSDASSQSNNGKRWLHFTNQDVNGNRDDKTYYRTDPPSNPTSTEHEYRIDWFADRVEYYVDGVLKKTMTTDVPSTSVPFVWNNWANADPGWTGAPPKTDANFRIKKIVMDYNT